MSLRAAGGRGRRIAPWAPAFPLRIAKTGDRPGPIVQNGLRSVHLLPIRGASKRTGKPDRKAGAQSHGTTSGPPGYRKERGYPMKGKTKKIVLAVAVIGAIAAGGVAFTAANTVPDSVAGYGPRPCRARPSRTSSTRLYGDGRHDQRRRPDVHGDHAGHHDRLRRRRSASTATPRPTAPSTRPTARPTCTGLTEDTRRRRHASPWRSPAPRSPIRLSAGGRPGIRPAVPLAG